MTNKKFLSSSIVAALLVACVSFYSCDKDELDPTDDGRILAVELCDCFTNAEDDASKIKCITDFEAKADKWKNEEREAFNAAFNQAICNPSPYDWYNSRDDLAATAIDEFCTFFTNMPEAADPAAGMQLMMTSGLYAKWSAHFYNEEFMGTVLMGLMGCPSVPDWYFCSFGMTDYCVQLTEEELADMGIAAAADLCEYFSTTADEGQEEQYQPMIELIMTKYPAGYTEDVFWAAVLSAMLENCGNAVPGWFVDYCAEGGVDLDTLGVTAAGELCEYFTTTTDDPQAQMQFVMGFMMGKYTSVMNNELFRSGFTNALCYDKLPAWFNDIMGQM